MAGEEKTTKEAELKAQVADLKAQVAERDQLISEMSEKLATLEKTAEAGAPVVKVGKQSYKFRFPTFYNPANPLQKLSATAVAANPEEYKDALAALTQTLDNGQLKYKVLEPVA